MTMGHGDHGDHGAPMTSGWRCAKLLWGWAPCDDRKGPDESTGTGSWSHDLSWLWPEILLVLMVLMAVLMALMATIVRYMPWIENDRDINQYKYRITHTEIVLYTVYIYNIYVCVCAREFAMLARVWSPAVQLPYSVCGLRWDIGIRAICCSQQLVIACPWWSAHVWYQVADGLGCFWPKNADNGPC